MKLKRLLVLFLLTCMLTLPANAGEIEMPPAPADTPAPQTVVVQPSPEPAVQPSSEPTLPAGTMEILVSVITGLLSAL